MPCSPPSLSHSVSGIIIVVPPVEASVVEPLVAVGSVVDDVAVGSVVDEVGLVVVGVSVVWLVVGVLVVGLVVPSEVEPVVSPLVSVVSPVSGGQAVKRPRPPTNMKVLRYFFCIGVPIPWVR